MLTVAEIEAAILARLQAQITTVAVETFPDRPERYKLKHPVGAVLVSYAGSRFDRREPTDVVIQDQTVVIECAVTMRNLHDHEGILPILHAVRQALTGWQIPGAEKAYPVREEFGDYDDGVWQYVTTFEVRTVHHEPRRARGLIEYTEGEGYALDQPAL